MEDIDGWTRILAPKWMNVDLSAYSLCFICVVSLCHFISVVVMLSAQKLTGERCEFKWVQLTGWTQLIRVGNGSVFSASVLKKWNMSRNQGAKMDEWTFGWGFTRSLSLFSDHSVLCDGVCVVWIRIWWFPRCLRMRSRGPISNLRIGDDLSPYRPIKYLWFSHSGHSGWFKIFVCS